MNHPTPYRFLRRCMAAVLVALAAFPALRCDAQDYSKMSPYLRHLVRSAASGAKGTGGSMAGSCVYAFVRGDEAAVSGSCVSHQDDIHIVRTTVEEIARLSEDDRVSRIECTARERRATLDSIASVTDAARLWEGTSLPQAYTGKGVVVGVADLGMDFTHPAFRTADGTSVRFSRVWDMTRIPDGQIYGEDERFPLGTLYTDPARIMAQGGTGDARLSSHGTHTTGTAAGGSYGTPFRGMAPEAELYYVNTLLGTNSSCVPKDFYDNAANSGVEMLAFQNIFDYADSIGKPCVVSYSIGSYPDITDYDELYNAYMEKLVSKPGHVFVASVGNDAQRRAYLSKDAGQTTVGGLLTTFSGDGQDSIVIMGVSTARPLTMRIRDYAYSDSGHEVTIPLDFTPDPQKARQAGTMSPSGLVWNEFVNRIHLDELDGASILVYSYRDGFDPDRAGYDITIIFSKGSLASHKYVVSFTGETGDGSEAEIFTVKGQLTSANAYGDGLDGAKSAGNILVPGGLPSAIGVGASAWRTSYTNYYGGSMYNNAGTGGQRATWSGIGPSAHHLVKPDVLAPGANICAAYSRIYQTEGTNDSRNGIRTQAETDGKAYAWTTMSGSSMSTPAVAGIIALWLQADPTLTMTQAMETIAATSRHYSDALAWPNNEYGYGEINAYKGLLHILHLTGTEGISDTHAKGATMMPDARGNILIALDGPLPHSTNIRAYTTDGRMAAATTLPPHSTTYTLALPSAFHGIIAVQLDGYGSTLVRLP